MSQTEKEEGDRERERRREGKKETGHTGEGTDRGKGRQLSAKELPL